MRLTLAIRAVGGLALLALLGVLAAWKWWPKGGPAVVEDAGKLSSPSAPANTAAADPRRTIATAFRNVRPEVRYVGDDACFDCHPRLSTTYHRHPMGRSLASLGDYSDLECYDAASRNPFDAGGFRYAVERRGKQMIHQETAISASGTKVFETEAEVEFAVGSGQRARSYLINRDGYLFASSLSWYSQKGIWDLSPG